MHQIGALSYVMEWSALARTPGVGVNSLLGWLLRSLEKVLVDVAQSGPYLCCLVACRGRNEELGEDGMLDGYTMQGQRTNRSCSMGDPGRYIITKVNRNVLVRGVLTPKSSGLVVLWRPELMAREQSQSWLFKFQVIRPLPPNTCQ